MHFVEENHKKSEAFDDKLDHMRLKIMPIYHLPGGPPHHAFPETLLEFHLLTEEELDSIAAYYSQITPDEWSEHYPDTMAWDADFFNDLALSDATRVQIKLRKFGKFIGLRGCETPIEETKLRIELAGVRIKRAIDRAKEEQHAQEKANLRNFGA